MQITFENCSNGPITAHLQDGNDVPLGNIVIPEGQHTFANHIGANYFDFVGLQLVSLADYTTFLHVLFYVKPCGRVGVKITGA